MNQHPLEFTVLLLLATAGCNTQGKNATTSPTATERAEARIVFRSDDGRVLTARDLANATGTFEYQIVNNDPIPVKTNELHQKARQLGAAGDYEQAIQVLSEAQSLAPDWPYPVYDMAFTYLLMSDYANAREQTVKLSPRGFFTALTALDTLNREAAGELPEGAYAAFMSLEWTDDPDQKAKMLEILVERLPNYAPAWKEYALQCEDPEDKLAALEKGLAASPDAETKGMLLINKALTLKEQGDLATAKTILGNLALDPNATFANEHLAKQTLAMFSE